MNIPSALLAAVKDLLRIPASDTTWNALIDDAFGGTLQQLLLDQDFFVEMTTIDAVAGQDIYTLPTTRFTRLLAVFWQHMALPRVTVRVMDLLSEWTTVPPATPEYFSVQAIPPGLDSLTSITPEQFVLIPAPAAASTGADGIQIAMVAVPETTIPVQYLDAYLTFATASAALAVECDIRDLPSSQLWNMFAEFWLQVIKKYSPGVA